MTMQQPARDEYDDPVNDLRYEPEITTRDVSKLLGVTQATVRRWVARGYISPVGKLGPSNLFSTSEVLAAHDDIEARRRRLVGCGSPTASGRSTTTRSSMSAKPRS